MELVDGCLQGDDGHLDEPRHLDWVCGQQLKRNT